MIINKLSCLCHVTFSSYFTPVFSEDNNPCTFCLYFLFFIEVYLNYNVVLVSGVQHSDSVIYILYIYIYIYIKLYSVLYSVIYLYVYSFSDSFPL